MLAAVIVTYNRKALLAENIDKLLIQRRPIDKIFIIDNCSTDGTEEMLEEKGWIPTEKFVYIKTESNIGGAGGFYTGTKAAYEAGADWILLMDDDGRAENEDTVEHLMTAAEAMYARNVADKKIYVNALVLQNEMLSFKMGSHYTVEAACSAAVDGILEGLASPFNGTLISKELVREIGYPNMEFFIKGDEVDYKHRAMEAGAYVCTAVNSRYVHPRPETYERSVLGKKVPFFVEAPWKEYYAARNFTYMYKKNKYYKAIAFELVFVKFLAILQLKCPKWKTAKMVLRGVCDGWAGRLGATVKP
jgi:rhamnopyranosyl-N-acetylglucosaminyl-diphospho-decaprenol beta-1,3/1,4-galactofuranosyltransferase